MDIVNRQISDQDHDFDASSSNDTLDILRSTCSDGNLYEMFLC